MKVLEAEAGSEAKEAAACCAATKGLLVLTFMSRSRSSSLTPNGSSGEVDDLCQVDAGRM